MDNYTDLTRRVFIQTAGSSALAFGGLGLCSALLRPSLAFAKPGGHLLREHECLATFQFEGKYREIFGPEPFQLYLAGCGYASFTNLQDYSSYDTAQFLVQDVVAMEWEINNCYAGNYPEWGTVAAIARVKKSSPDRSYIVFRAREKGKLFPADAITILYFDIEFPKLNVTVINREPIVLAGTTTNLSSQDILGDPRYMKNPAGLSAKMRQTLKRLQELEARGERFDGFEPAGELNLVNPVKYYLKSDPNEHVVTLIRGTLLTQTHYGLDVQLVSTRMDGGVLDAEFSIANLTGQEQDIVWYVGDSYNLSIVYTAASTGVLHPTGRQGAARLGSEPMTVTVQAYNNNPRTPLGIKACLFCGAQNTPRDLQSFRSEFAADFTVAEHEDFERMKRADANRGDRRR
jgi:hypothetical protein